MKAKDPMICCCSCRGSNRSKLKECDEVVSSCGGGAKFIYSYKEDNKNNNNKMVYILFLDITVSLAFGGHGGVSFAIGAVVVDGVFLADPAETAVLKGV